MAESQTQTTVEQPVAPAAPKTYESQDALAAAMKAGEVDVRQYKSPQEMVEALVKAPESVPEQPAVESQMEQPTPEPKPQETPAPAENVSRETSAKTEQPMFKSFGEMLKFAKEELGEEYTNAHDFIQKVKNKKEHLARNQSALNRWRDDATKNKQAADTLQRQLADLQKKMKEIESRPVEPQQQQAAPAPVADEVEPEIPMPDDLADAKEWGEYARRVNERNQRILKKEMDARLSDMEKRANESEAKWQRRLEEEKAKIQKENDERTKRELANRQFENTIAAADRFISKRKEFDFGSSTKDMNDKYGQFVAAVRHVQSQNPVYASRDLVRDYLNGVPDAVKFLESYAIEPPQGTKQFAVLLELEKIAQQHKLYTNTYTDSSGETIGGDPDFDAAYAIKKARDGADIDELNQAHARGANQALEVVQHRQAQQPELGARETVPNEENVQQSQEQLLSRMQQIQSQMSTMTPEQRQQARQELAAMASKVGLVQQP